MRSCFARVCVFVCVCVCYNVSMLLRYSDKIFVAPMFDVIYFATSLIFQGLQIRSWLILVFKYSWKSS